MKFADKLIHGGPVHPSYEPLQVLQQCMVLYSVGALKQKKNKKIKKKQTM